ncbi:hypothetical protein PSACC_03685 [Paramicrosporidium saccamoebae]|uniref:Coenzyme Q-binding protein COQ10 START domain-containing protein n=1 Tax=Paramicrosporidium saccamoebae TaxID=1246581 RepID=A0A2H9TFD6_9FUNG|nr:hypothetical protein PSACC_03685 [Paramicrosporidium saccamoebae]
MGLGRRALFFPKGSDTQVIYYILAKTYPTMVPESSSATHEHWGQEIEQVYSVISDVDKYPEFVPWCVGTQETERFLTDADQKFVEAGGISAANTVRYIEMAVGFKALNDKYVSRAEAIDARLFKHLVSEWRFSPAGSSCLVNFKIDFEFRSYLYAYFANMFFAEVALRMVDAFEKRCHELFDSKSS